MARIRSVKPEIRTDLTVAGWPREVRYAWVLLWGYLDDHGRGRDDMRLVVADLFPLDRDVTEKKMDRWLHTMTSVKADDDREPPLCRYEVAGQRYFHAVNWANHQRVSHARDSYLPACPVHDDLANDSRTAPELLPNRSGIPPESLPNDSALARAGVSREQGAGSSSGARPDDDDRKTARELLDATGPWTQGVRDALGPHVLAALPDFEPAGVKAALVAYRGKLGDPNTRPGLLPYLIQEHAARLTPAKPPRAPWCGVCDAGTRMRDNPADGLPMRCPDCGSARRTLSARTVGGTG